MDTIQIKLQLKNRRLSIEEYKIIECDINNLLSPGNYTFCDVLDFRNESSIGIKISYPRFFYGSNVFLITTKEQCFQVQRYFCEAIKQLKIAFEAEIFLERVDIPFTYMMAEDFDFYSYSKAYGIMAMVHAEKIKNGARKMYSDILTQKPETLIYCDSRTPSAYNNKVIIYNQYENVQAKTEDEETLAIYNNQYPDLKNRMRIEVSKRIRRNPFSIERFAEFDMVGNYLEKLKTIALDKLLDFKLIESIYQTEAIQLANLLNIQRQISGFSYEVFIWQNIFKIYDYEILRRALGIAIDNTKTRESAVTAVRKHLNSYTLNNSVIVMDVYQNLWEIRALIQNYQIL